MIELYPFTISTVFAHFGVTKSDIKRVYRAKIQGWRDSRVPGDHPRAIARLAKPLLVRKSWKSGFFKLRELCAYLELGKILEHLEIVLLEICRLPRFFSKLKTFGTPPPMPDLKAKRPIQGILITRARTSGYGGSKKQTTSE